MAKYIFITGGVVSSLGKGITAASLGCLLKMRGFKLTIQKLDPYINYDPGTMSPYQHGEVFVTEDGAETDLDLGHYERFIHEDLSQDNNLTTGKVYWSVINRERRGGYKGETVQVIPHITDEIKKHIIHTAESKNAHVAIIEIGGPVGDIESLPFLEAIRQMRADLGKENVVYLHVTLVPYLSTTAELKTKPTQHSVKELRSIGIQPDMIVCRTEHPLSRDLKDKIALFGNIAPGEVIENTSADFIYEVPLLLQQQELDALVLDKLQVAGDPADISSLEEMVKRCRNRAKEVTIGLVGKYVALKDAYISISEAITHAGLHHHTVVDLKLIPAEELETNSPEDMLAGLDGILVPGGFGERGIQGKINAIRVARQHHIPFLGLCLSMQCAVIEFARNVAGLTEAHSTEFDPHTAAPVIHLLPGQAENTNLGGTLRLGSYPCTVKPGTIAHQAYQKSLINERHRHRYEFNNRYRSQLEKHGLVCSGIYEDDNLVEIIELPAPHPWFVAVQFHPEFKSRPGKPHPLFRDFIGSALKNRETS